jgi:AcrR family transcriptional regulator
MQRGERSERSRRQVLDAALALFSRQGYRATSVREIAEAARVSIGNVYHHFPDKESIFTTLLDEYRELGMNPRFPIVRALTAGRFPGNLEQIGVAARDSVRQYRQYMALHFVAAIEFDGVHTRAFYREIAQRLTEYTAQRDFSCDVRSDVSPVSAMLIATRLFLSYFQLEILFGVPEPFAKEPGEIIREISDILRKGIAP